MDRQVIKKLLEWRDRAHKPLILKGARQVGKTFVLKEFGKRYFPQFHYLNFEEESTAKKVFIRDLNPKRILQDLEFYFNKPINAATDLIIFDEIQDCPQALTSLKYFAEETPTIHLCAAGSLLGLEMNEGSFPVGKVEFLPVYPMTFKEFLLALGDEKSLNIIDTLKSGDALSEVVHDHLWDLFKNYLVVGGLPEAVATFVQDRQNPFSAFAAVRKKQNDLVLAYLADIAKHSGKLNSMHIQRVLKNIPEQLARNQDQSAAKFRFKDVVPGVHGYSRLVGPIDWLVAAGLAIKIKIANRALPPLSAYTKENIFKLFLFDVGLLGSLSGLAPKSILDYDYGSYKGYFAENFIAQEFVASGAGNLYAWNEGTAEIEFIREIAGKALPVEVKSGWVTQAKSLKIFAQKYEPPYVTVMSARNLNFDKKNGRHAYPLYLASEFPLKEKK